MCLSLHSRSTSRFNLLISFGILWISLPLGTPLAAEETSESDQTQVQQVLQQFLKQYCSDCHGAKTQKGDRRFDRLAASIQDDNTLVDYQDILDQLNLGEMPPAKLPQPKPEQRRKVVEILTEKIEQFHQSRKSASAQPILRRLNSREYKNTIRDLFHLNTTIFDPTVEFPLDQTSEHLDNLGSELVTSGHLLDRYLSAAETVVGKALFPSEQPEVQTWTFRDGFRQQPEIDQVFRKVNDFAWMTLFDVVGADKHEGAYGPIHAFAEGVPYDGFYEIKLKAEAVNREHPYDPEFLGTDPSEPLRLGIVAGHQDVGPLHKPQPIEPLLAEIELADEQKWYTVRVWLDQGYTPRMTFRNGLMDVRNLYSRLLRKYPDEFPKQKKPGIVEARFNAIKYGKMPQIRIHEIEIKGPLYDDWPRAGQRVALGDDWAKLTQEGTTAESLRPHLHQFMNRAYRRPASKPEVDRIMQIIHHRRNEGRDLLSAYGDGLQAVLCSPAFLYINTAESLELPDYALASRLSYFLWSSMPDEELLNLAAKEELHKPDVLAAQTERMLADPKSDAFVDGFLASWLTLRDLGSMPPDRGKFTNYYHYDLDSAMREETRRFVRHLLDENLSITNFLDADFTFVNRPLARFYDVPLPNGFGFEKVALNDSRRGGLLGQASILTVTANGIDTSPVVRGVWLLENILGTPPSPPPPDVEPLDPDIRGAKTIRDQLQKHRDVPSCADCHRKIDPLGFALENFDPIGQWRVNYSNKTKIDSSGELPNGQAFQDVKEFKSILLERKEQFASALTEKMLAYATGRHTGPADRPEIDSIVAAMSDDSVEGKGFRDLVKRIVMSEAFHSN